MYILILDNATDKTNHPVFNSILDATQYAICNNLTGHIRKMFPEEIAKLQRNN